MNYQGPVFIMERKGFRLLSPDEVVAAGDFLEWLENAWTDIAPKSEFIGKAVKNCVPRNPFWHSKSYRFMRRKDGE